MFFKDKKILIIGGTGTIGQSLVKHILKEQPKLIRILSRDEYKQFHLQNKLGNQNNLQFLIGDVRDYDRVVSALEDIDYVFHVAAMKHVPTCEYNPYEAVQTNINGTYNVIKAASAQNVKKVVFTSSDKAISPTNTYGATKLIAERLISSAQYSNGRINTTFASVRFGNVMGSRGSVIPLFIRQILKNKKVTVTNLKMTRFMMTLNQATSLTIKALQESKGGEVFVLKMPVITLKDMVKVVIEQTCKKYNLNSSEIKIEEIGLRLGEKMYEELMTYDESTIAWELPEMFIIPGIREEKSSYLNARVASYGTYSSDSHPPISIEEIKTIILSENLI
ncbi:SDR family NAD(P)-dependent oxidoreductase [Alkalihalobacterium alkalinitrilicum]|uniref:SDR family NAD(P)-dependent oxidoreductase n=1 Tax=Alkalihalobacterium alkalinitrilicum TaxID=427920 RepID=UPI000994CF61|nr:SDR family NAD(P)-dependent oxidoreductase [Alkalihalobacterium alkalinitrilicum]